MYFFVLYVNMNSSKQELVSRRRNDKLNGRLSEIKAQEREKVKQGKKPFFLKRSAIKEIALEERYCCLLNAYLFLSLIATVFITHAIFTLYLFINATFSLLYINFIYIYRYDELKKEGKLSSFLEKKRKKNSSKDRRSLPFIKSSSRKDEGDN